MGKPVFPDGEWIEDQRPMRHGWAPGGYMFKCRGCKHNGGKDRVVIGDKRAIMCADCAYALPDPQPSVPRLPAPTELEVKQSAQLLGLAEAVQGAIDGLTSWFLDRTTEGTGFEDYDPEIDDVRSALQEALQKAADA